MDSAKMTVIYTDYGCLRQYSCYYHHLQQTSESKLTKRKESVSAVDGDDAPPSTVASSIFESVVFSGNIVKSIHTGEEEESEAPAASEATAVANHTSANG
jgi:hypothetical protein